eukprot:4583110-Alexandrium_andersonii.AAC.1
MRRRSSQWPSANSKSAGPTRSAARTPPSSGCDCRSGRCGGPRARGYAWPRARGGRRGLQPRPVVAGGFL